VSLALIGHAYPTAQQRDGALAVYAATIGASYAVGPLVGGLLTQHLGWRRIFLVNVPAGLVCLGLTAIGVEESRDPQPRRVDWAGQVLLTGPASFSCSACCGNEDGWGSAAILGELVGAAVLLVAFLATEALVAEPMLPLVMFRNRPFTGPQVAAFAISSSPARRPSCSAASRRGSPCPRRCCSSRPASPSALSQESTRRGRSC
jgi:MFS family permease